MSSSSTASLQTLIPGWPATAPSTLLELVHTEPAELRALHPELDHPLLLDLRRQAVEAYRAADAPAPLPTATSVREALRQRHIRSVRGQWVIYALDAKRQRIYQPRSGSKAGGTFALYLLDPYVPWGSTVRENLPIPRGGGYFMIYGGEPSDHTPDVVIERLVTLCTETPVVDVVWWTANADSYTMWSAKGGCGMTKGSADPLDLPARFDPVTTALKGGAKS